MLCLSGFELYSRWVPLNLGFQIDQIPSLCTDAPWERELIFSEGRDTGNTGNESRPVKPCFFSYLVRYYNFTTLFSNGSLQNTFREFLGLDKIEGRRKISSHVPGFTRRF